MSKRRRKNRPRGGPSHKPHQKQSPNNPEISVVNHTRRRVILGGTAAAILGVLGYNIFRGDKTPEQLVQKKALEKSGVKPKIPEYEEWASKIKLPNISLDEKPLEWSLKQKEKHFLKGGPLSIPEGAPPEAVSKLVEHVAKMVRICKEELDKTNDPGERQKILSTFVFALSKVAYGKVIHKNLNAIPASSMHLVIDLNRLLLTRDYYMDFVLDYKGLGKFAFYRVQKMHSVDIEFENKETQIPVAFLDNASRVELFGDSNSGHLPIATYFDAGQFIAIDIDQQMDRLRQKLKYYSYLEDSRPNESPELYTDYLEMIIQHEGMHAVMERLNGFSSQEERPVKPLAKVNMGQYELDYSPGGPNVNIIELAASGFGVMHGGASARHMLYSYIQSGGIYKYIARVVFQELKHDSEIDLALRKKLKGDDPQDVERVLQILSQLPDEKIFKIGERMAKLGLYLAQK